MLTKRYTWLGRSVLHCFLIAERHTVCSFDELGAAEITAETTDVLVLSETAARTKLYLHGGLADGWKRRVAHNHLCLLVTTDYSIFKGLVDSLATPRHKVLPAKTVAASSLGCYSDYGVPLYTLA